MVTVPETKREVPPLAQSKALPELREEAMDKLSLLAVFAHPDDESCGPGATLARYASEGVDVTLVCTTKGERGAWGADQGISLEQFGTTRIQELACACKRLGIRRWVVLGYPDDGVAQCNRRALEGELVRWIRTVRPQVVVTCYPEGEIGHPDHDTIARVAAKAYLGAGRTKRFPQQLEEGLAPWQPSKLYYCLPPDPDLASRVEPRFSLTTVEVSAFVQAKLRAMQCHQSQKQCSQGFAEVVRSNPHWTESFYLAHSRVAPAAGAEDDLFHGTVSDARTSGRTVR